MANLKDMKCIAIIGRAGSGKDTVAKYISEYIYGTGFDHACSLKFSEPLKEACCSIFGWDIGQINNLEYKEEPIHDELQASRYTLRPDGSYDRFPVYLTTRRSILQYIGTNVFRALDPDVWVKAAIREADEIATHCEVSFFVSTDCRFPNEQAGLQRAFGSTYFVRLHRAGEKQRDTHESEKVDLLHADVEFHVASGDLERLRQIAKIVVHDFLSEFVEEVV